MSIKFLIDGKEHILVDGIWFEYDGTEYVLVKDNDSFENNYIIQQSETKMTINTKDYQNFVTSTISKPSSNFKELISSLDALEEAGKIFNVSIPELLTASVGLSAESGEFTEVVKKLIFQGKPLTEDNIFHMKRELGDVCWYLSVACTALNTTLDEILIMNVEKLSARYPDGFEIIKSEVRIDGDI